MKTKSDEIFKNINEELEIVLGEDKNISVVPNSIIVDEDISMDIEVSIDGSESSIILEEVDNSNLEDLFDGKNLKIESEEIALVVPLPTKSPVLAPTSSIPTIAPSITGLVASIEISKPVTSSLSTEELDLIEQTIVDAFFNGTAPIEGEEAPYNVQIEYTTQGTMKVDVPSGTSEEDVINVLVDSIAETLGVHPSNIEVEYNPTTGEVIYIITSEDAETLSDITSILEEDLDSFEDELNANLIVSSSEILGLEFGGLISISDVEAPTEIVAEIEVIVDATDLPNNVDPEEAINEMETKLEEEGVGFEVEGEVNYITSAPTFVPSEIPSLSPSTSIPSAAPSYFGMVANRCRKKYCCY